MAHAAPAHTAAAVAGPAVSPSGLLSALAGVLLAALLLLLALIWPPPARGLSDGAEGARLFEAHCAGCHIQGGNIIRRGKTLRLEALRRNGLADPAAIAAVAAAGRGQMSGYGEVLGAEGVEAVAAWVWDQAQSGWPRS